MQLATAPLWAGMAIGAFCVTALGVWHSELRRDAKLATVLACLSAAAWVLTESEPAWAAVGQPYPVLLLSFPAAGFFWAFVACVFQDRPLRGLAFAPAAILALAGIAITVAPPGLGLALRAGFNVAAAGLCLHAAYLIVRSWRDDLVESRRTSRFVILGAIALFATAQGAAGAVDQLGPNGLWAGFAVQGALGSVAVAALGLAMGGLLLQARTPLFETRASRAPAEDPKLAAADRALLAKLEAFMEAGQWREERLSIAAVARELGTLEHRLRRLINARLGHRNFPDFINGYRVQAAKARLADATQADVTIAAIAFDLGFGSLSPFNRAFRASTGSTPTEWRRTALQAQLAARAD